MKPIHLLSSLAATLALVALAVGGGCATTDAGVAGDGSDAGIDGPPDIGFDPWAGYDGGAYHPEGWSDPSSHGSKAKGGIALCQYCHGNDLTGGSVGVSCDSCHTGGSAWRTNCTFCHGGTDNKTGAPPRDTQGKTAITEVTVGHHTTHLAGGPLSNPVACTECHVVPTDVLSPGHIDGPPAEVTFGTLAKTGGANPSFDRASATCGSVYCHGNFSGGKTTNKPVWTGANQAACGSCHTNRPLSGQHWHYPFRANCDDCHPGVNSNGSAITDKSKHVNGIKDVGGPGTSIVSWSRPSCTPQCHGRKTW